MTQRGPVHLSESQGSLVDVMGAFSCDECGHLSLATSRIERTYIDGGRSAEPFLLEDDAPVWLPATAVGKDFPDVPEHIASAADEVHRCLSIGAARAAVGLARAVVEATAKDKGIAKGRIGQKIDALADAGHVRPVVREAAHEVRIDGNGVAHGDLADSRMTTDEAADVVALMDELPSEVYQAPARMARVRSARAARARPDSDER